MRRSPVAVLLLVAAACACSGTDANKVAGAAITAGAAVAVAGIHRAATGGCWADCRPGTRCDKESGTCVRLPCGGSCGPGERCSPVEGEERCVPRLSDEPMAGEPRAPGVGNDADAGAPSGDPCRGLCMRGEHCVVLDGGVADCAPDDAARRP